MTWLRCYSVAKVMRAILEAIIGMVACSVRLEGRGYERAWRKIFK
jgi:hypothetical protein